MNERIEKWFMIGIGIIILMMFVGAVLSAHQRQTCRMELARAGRSAEDILKICP